MHLTRSAYIFTRAPHATRHVAPCPHHRWFIDRICTHILAFEGDSQVTFFNGNYQEYEAEKKKRLGEEGAKPHRIRFKALK